MASKEELIIQKTLAQRLSSQYPKVLFRSDLGGTRLSMGLRIQAKQLQGNKAKYWPDIFIAEPRHGYAGYFGELKRNESEIFTQMGQYRQDKHTQGQLAMLEELRKRGYKADFWWGLDDAWLKIQIYLGAIE